MEKNKITVFVAVSLTLVGFTLLSSCDGDRKAKKIANVVSEWQGREIIFPKDLVFTRYARDTVDYQIPETDYKVVTYVDSAGCAGCRLKLKEWKEFMAQTDSITDKEVAYLFFIYPHDYEEMYYIFEADGFDHVACIDLDDSFNQLNRLPTNMNAQTFLLDKSNKVIVIGNPVYSPEIKKLYVKQLTNKERRPEK